MNNYDAAEFDEVNQAKKVNIVAGGAGLATITPLQAWPDPKTFIGLVTVTGSLAPAAGNVTLDAGSKTGIVGNLTLSDPKGFIGLVTVGNTVAATFSGNVTLDPGSKTGIVGNLTLTDSKGFIGLVTTQAADPKGYIGLVTVTQASSIRSIAGNLTITDSKGFIGLTTAVNGQAWPDPKAFIGLVTVVQGSTTRSIAGNLTLSDPKGFIGLTTAVNGQAWPDPKGYIGLVTITGSLSAAAGNITLDPGSKTQIVGNLTLSDPKAFIGLVTAWSLNAGTTKTLQTLPITLSTASIQTVFTPTNANVVKVTNILLSSDATVRVSIKSGVTYLTGNASIGISLNPAGGFVNPGSPDAPVFIGCPSGALNIEKLDLTATSAKIGGSVTFFQE